MIVKDLDVFSARRRPAEAHAKLVVHADAVLAGTLPFESFEPVSRWHAQVVEASRDLQLPQLTSRDCLDARDRLTRRPFARASVSAFRNDTIIRV